MAGKEMEAKGKLKLFPVEDGFYQLHCPLFIVASLVAFQGVEGVLVMASPAAEDVFLEFILFEHAPVGKDSEEAKEVGNPFLELAGHHKELAR